MKKRICMECDGSGIWVMDEAGNEYKHPIKCEDCGGKGFIEID